MSRVASTNRAFIASAMAEKLKELDQKAGSDGYTTKLHNNVLPHLVLWDQIHSFPAVCITPGDEDIEYLPGRRKDRTLDINIRIFVNSTDPLKQLEGIVSDIETFFEENGGRLEFVNRYGDTNHVTDISFKKIKTDEGVLAPLGIGEIFLSVKYIQ